MKLSVLALFFCLFGGRITKANTQTAASCNTSDVQAAINSAAEGDTLFRQARALGPPVSAYQGKESLSGELARVELLRTAPPLSPSGRATKTLSITSTAVNPSYAITPNSRE